MTEDRRRDIRKEYKQEIGFESMLAGEQGRSVASRTGQAVDIAHGGLGLVTPYSPAQGEVLKLSIPLKDPEVTLPVFAEVMWVTSSDGYYRAGLRFPA